MEIVEDTSERFQLTSQPSIFSQAAFAGFFAFGFTLSFYSESIFWQLLYILGSFVIASSFLGQWQKLTIEKVSKKLHYEVQNIYQKIFASDRYLVCETLDLEHMRQVKYNVANGTISFYHDITTISIYIGKPSECEAMLAKVKSHMPGPTISRHEGQPGPDTLEDVAEEPKEAKQDMLDTAAVDDDGKMEAEVGDLPKTISFDSFKDEEDGLSSDESFVKIDDREFDDCAQAAGVSQMMFEREDESTNTAEEKQSETQTEK